MNTIIVIIITTRSFQTVSFQTVLLLCPAWDVTVAKTATYTISVGSAAEAAVIRKTSTRNYLNVISSCLLLMCFTPLTARYLQIHF